MSDADHWESLERELPPFLDAAQVAELLGVAVTTVYSWTRQGLLPSYRPGGAKEFRFLRGEVLDFVRSSVQPHQPDDRDDDRDEGVFHSRG